MPNYFGVLDSMEIKTKKAREILIEGTLSAFLQYYSNELHRSTYLEELTNEVNEACEIAITEAVAGEKCYASFLQTAFDEDDIVSFDFYSEKLGNLGVIEIAEGATLFIKKEKVASLLERKTVTDLNVYTKHLEQIERLLLEHGIEVIFA